MLRTLFVLALVAYGIRQSVRGPFYALLFYLWLAYFRPERWVWGGVVQSLPLSLVVGVIAILAGLMSMQLIFNWRVMLLWLFVAQGLLSTLTSDYSAFAWPYWQDFAKSIGITWLIASLATDAKRIRMVALVIALSLGFEATKQGWLQLVLNPGAKNFNEIAAIGDNNGVAIGMYVLVALLVALGRTASSRWEKWVMRFMATGSLYRGIVTYSRGGFLAGGAMALIYLARSKRKVATIAAMTVLAILIVPVLPDAFWERMGTMNEAFSSKKDPTRIAADEDEADQSFAGRLHFWRVALVMAEDRPLTGVGHNAYTQAYDKYDFDRGFWGVSRSVHSSWMGTLAELGYPGLLLVLLNMGAALLACRQVRRLKGDDPDIPQLREFAMAIESAVVVIAVGGTFVIFQYTELMWHVLGLSIALQQVAAAKQKVNVPAPTPVRVVALPRAAAIRSV